jgi:hypothetical protein
MDGLGVEKSGAAGKDFPVSKSRVGERFFGRKDTQKNAKSGRFRGLMKSGFSSLLCSLVPFCG